MLPLLAACAATHDEPVGSSSSALNPEVSINSVTYTFALSSVEAINVWNPGQGQYTEYAAIGASTKTFGSTTNAQLVNTPIGCSLGAVPLGTPPPYGDPQTLTMCKSATTNGTYAANTPMATALSQTVTLNHETDVVNFAVSLDNTGGTTISQIPGGVGSDLNLTGSALSTYGTVVGVVTMIPTLGAGAVAGAAISKIGSLLSWIGNELGTTVPVTSCGGGLIGNGPDPNGIPSAPPYDTLYYSYTAAQLEAMTNATGTGGFVVSTPVSVSWPQALQGDVATTCNSQHQINVTITRVPGSGPAADPLSGSIAVARTPTEIDAIVGDPGRQGMADFQGTPSGGWTPSVITPATYSPGSYTPTATLSRQMLPSGTQLTLVSAAGVTAPPTTALQGSLDSFWFDSNGTLQWSEQLPGSGWTTGSIANNGGGTIPNVPSSRVTATSRTPSVMDVFWIDGDGDLADATLPGQMGATAYATNEQSVAAGVAPKGGGVAAVSRTFDTEDVFYIGNDGGLHDATYTLESPLGYAWKVNPVGGTGIAPPGAYVTAVARDANTIDAFFIGTKGTVYWARYASTAVSGLPAAGWQAPQAVPGAIGSPGGPITAVSRSQATIDLVYYDANKLEFTEYNPAGPSNWTAPAQISEPGMVNPNTDLSLVASPDGSNLALFFSEVFDNPYAATWNQAAGTWQVSALAVPVVPFSLSTPESSFTIGAGNSTDLAINATAPAGLTLSLAATGLPSSVVTSLSATSVASGGESTLSIAVPAELAPGTYSFMVTATAEGMTYDLPVSMTVTACVGWTCSQLGVACGTTGNGCGQEITCGPACAPAPVPPPRTPPPCRGGTTCE